MQYEKKKQEADKVLVQAINARAALHKQVHGPDYRRGIIGVDSCNNENSHIYGERFAKQREEESIRHSNRLNRHDSLAKHTSSILTGHNIIVPETVDVNNNRTIKLYQSKGGSYHGPTFDETKKIFTRVVGRVDKDRQQFIRNQDLGGKSYNIITHVAVDQKGSSFTNEPISCGERLRPEHKSLVHPSQVSLEGSRNLQGSLRPY
jgi:hypothetical protein